MISRIQTLLSREARIRHTAARFAVEIADSQNNHVHARAEAWMRADPRHAQAMADSLDALGYATLAAQHRSPSASIAALPSRSTHRMARYAVAACLLLMLGLAAAHFTGILSGGTSLFKPASEKSADFATEEVGQLFRSPDGSTLTLGPHSAVRLAIASKERRILLLKGRARFDVAHDSAHPFIVQADGTTVTALGTVFDVSLRGTSDVRVSLFKGSVEVRRSDNKARPAVTRLSPGERVDYSAAAAEAVIPQPVMMHGFEAGWTDPKAKAAFDNVALGDIIDEANLRSSMPIRLDDPGLRRTPITGTFRIDDGPLLAKRLAHLLDLQQVQDASGIRLTTEAKR